MVLRSSTRAIAGENEGIESQRHTLSVHLIRMDESGGLVNGATWMRSPGCEEALRSTSSAARRLREMRLRHRSDDVPVTDAFVRHTSGKRKTKRSFVRRSIAPS